MTLPVQTLPATIQSVIEARPGPSVDGAPLRPGDIVVTPEGTKRVVVETGFGTTNAAVGLFDPDDGGRVTAPGQGTSIDGTDWNVTWRNLGTATGLDREQEQRLLATAGFDPRTERYAWAKGRAPVAALAVQPQTVAHAGSVIDLRRALKRPFDRSLEPFSKAGSEGEGLLERVRSQVGTCAERRSDSITDRRGTPGSDRDTPGRDDEATTPALWTTTVQIPTGEQSPVLRPERGEPLKPGDRLIYWDRQPPAAPLSADRDALARGHCQVLLRQSDGPNDARERPQRPDGIDCYDLTRASRTRFGRDELAKCHEQAVESGLVLRLVARDCFVDPIGTERTYSVHVYATTGVHGNGLLLAGTCHGTSTPRLEHPLALSKTVYDHVDGITDALRGSTRPADPLSAWTDESQSIASMCERIADRIENSDRPSTIPGEETEI